MEPSWKPLEQRLGTKRCAGFMFMARVNGINLYKHGIARMYLNLDDSGRCYISRPNWRFERADFSTELAKLEAALTALGACFETPYNDAYIAQKRNALQRAGIPLHRIEIEPEDVSMD